MVPFTWEEEKNVEVLQDTAMSFHGMSLLCRGANHWLKLILTCHPILFIIFLADKWLKQFPNEPGCPNDYSKEHDDWPGPGRLLAIPLCPCSCQCSLGFCPNFIFHSWLPPQSKEWQNFVNNVSNSSEQSDCAKYADKVSFQSAEVVRNSKNCSEGVMHGKMCRFQHHGNWPKGLYDCFNRLEGRPTALFSSPYKWTLGVLSSDLVSIHSIRTITSIAAIASICAHTHAITWTEQNTIVT